MNWNQEPQNDYEALRRKIGVSRANGEKFTCACCGIKNYKVSIDHIIPVVYGGSNDKHNLQILCVACNTKKGSKMTLKLWKHITDAHKERFHSRAEQTLQNRLRSKKYKDFSEEISDRDLLLEIHKKVDFEILLPKMKNNKAFKDLVD